MIPSIDYLSLIIVGGMLWHVGQATVNDGDNANDVKLERIGWGIAIVGLLYFILGAVRSLMSALGW